MTDEELGRAWCERIGKRPNTSEGEFRWHDSYFFGPNHANLPEYLYSAAGCAYRTEGEAYAAIGESLRLLLTLADEVLAFADGVRANPRGGAG